MKNSYSVFLKNLKLHGLLRQKMPNFWFRRYWTSLTNSSIMKTLYLLTLFSLSVQICLLGQKSTCVPAQNKRWYQHVWEWINPRYWFDIPACPKKSLRSFHTCLYGSQWISNDNITQVWCTIYHLEIINRNSEFFVRSSLQTKNK